MKNATKIWLWIALVLCVCTTGLNLSQRRWLSVAIALVSIVGLCAVTVCSAQAGLLGHVHLCRGFLCRGSFPEYGPIGRLYRHWHEPDWFCSGARNHRPVPQR